MRYLMLGCAAALVGTAAATAPAQAQQSSPHAYAAPRVVADGVRIHHGTPGDGDHPDRVVNVLVGGGYYYSGGEWALYNNRSWESDSYNDWWHDRPDRAYPRWIADNKNCDRMWWSGGVWRC